MSRYIDDRAARIADQWRRERPDLDPSPMVPIGRLMQAARLIQRDHLQPVFARFGLGPGEFDVLASLRRSGDPYRLTPTALYSQLMITSGAMTNRIDRLEKAGLVERLPDPGDRRGTLVALTAEGKDRVDAAVSVHVANEARILSALTPEEQGQLSALLGKLLASVSDDPEKP